MMMRFQGKKISAILGILPENIGYFDDEVENYTFPVKQTMRLKKVMGYDKHRLSKETSTVSDFAVLGLKHMLCKNWITEEEIGAIIVVTLCPDYFVPHISNIVQAKCNLPKEVVCMDIAQGCCGYIVGLMEAFFFLEHMENGKKVILINGDVLMHRISKHDRNEYPVMGDASAISIIENSLLNEPIYLDLNMDGSKGDVLKMPAGGFRMPSSPQTAEMKQDKDGNIRALDHMYMDGGQVFNFVMREVPPMVERLYRESGCSVDETDYFLFHQPNKFILEKLAAEMKIPRDKMPMDLVENYGNPSGASIPLVAALDLREELLQNSYKCCLSGFGSGLAYGAVLMNLGNLDNCEIVETEL